MKSKINSKGQIQQVFIYIATILIVGLVLIVGYKAIDNMMHQGCDVEKVTFKSNLETFIKDYSSYGSLHKESLKLPCSAQKICFVDTETIGDQNFIFGANIIIQNSIRGDIAENIFMILDDRTEPFGFIEEIAVNEGAVCINATGGRLHLTFTGQGRTTAISGS
ncbi:MAG: hypothetical protein ABIB43_02795 [archaeon]